MSGLPDHASGISMAITCASERPDWYRNSTALSSEAESLPPGIITGYSFSICSPYSGLSSSDWRAFIQLTLPRMVLISPLWQTYRYGCASFQLGNVLVEKR